MELEDVFSSKLRIKSLKLIYQLGSLNVSDIARRLKSNFSATSENLKILEAEGILHELVYGRVRMYRFNEASAKAKAVQNLIEAWEQN
ncbi:MAG: winged helix-turn-helix domain-containing protein [Candidatus Bathyarchaeia archaeon]|jgi:DNA-binding transcriptional ArsR family regulator